MSDEKKCLLSASSKDGPPSECHPPKKTLNYYEALFNLLKAFLGTGILAMPIAFKNAGWVVGGICTLIFGLIIYYAANVVIRGIYELCKRHSKSILTYRQAMQLALEDGPPSCHRFSYFSGCAVDVLLVAYYVGVCSVYTVFIGRNIEQIVDYFIAGEYDGRLYMLLMGLPLLALMMIRHLKYLAPLAFAALLMLAIGVILLFKYILADLPPLRERFMFGDLSSFPAFFGDLFFAMSSFGVMIAIGSNMETPSEFIGSRGVLTVAMATMTVVYGIFGFFGFWRYGEETKGSITLNIPQDEFFSIAIKALFVMAIFFSYALNGYVPVTVVCHHLNKKLHEDKIVIVEYLVRFSTVLLTVILAISVPKLSVIISLVGSMCSGCLTLIFPGIMGVCINYSTGYGRYKQLLITDGLLVILGVIGVILGTIYSLKSVTLFYEELETPGLL